MSGQEHATDVLTPVMKFSIYIEQETGNSERFHARGDAAKSIFLPGIIFRPAIHPETRNHFSNKERRNYSSP
jgi:hypothetical protein